MKFRKWIFRSFMASLKESINIVINTIYKLELNELFMSLTEALSKEQKFLRLTMHSKPVF